jgi:hypothetical protein
VQLHRAIVAEMTAISRRIASGLGDTVAVVDRRDRAQAEQ